MPDFCYIEFQYCHLLFLRVYIINIKIYFEYYIIVILLHNIIINLNLMHATRLLRLLNLCALILKYLIKFILIINKLNLS